MCGWHAKLMDIKERTEESGSQTQIRKFKPSVITRFVFVLFIYIGRSPFRFSKIASILSKFHPNLFKLFLE